MKTLAFDTSNGAFSIAILHNQKVLQLFNAKEEGRQAELLVPSIEEVLRQNKIWYNDLDLLASTKGPGSFTGVRIGLSCARALKIATNLPLMTLDSLAVLAFKHRVHQGKIIAAIDAKMDEFFVAEFSSQNKKLTRLTESRLVKVDEFQEILQNNKDSLICGSAKTKDDFASADFVGLLAYEEFQAGNFNEDDNPTYLRGPKITERKKRN
jgi:tRNA threonylcarbamoyladenosine biosynthesis protein TsaB